MLSARPDDRTSMCTRLAVSDRNTAACPAEFSAADHDHIVAGAQTALP